MTRNILKTLKADLMRVQEGDVVMFKLGDVKENLIPTEEDLEKFGEMVKQVIKQPFPFLVVPAYVNAKIIRKYFNGKKKKGKRKTR